MRKKSLTDESQIKQPSVKRRVWRILGRIGICFLSAVVFLTASVYAFLYSVLNGPSPTVRDKLVLSALEGSATKWLPGLFLPQATVDAIAAESRSIATDSVYMDDYVQLPETDGGELRDEFEGYPDGIRIDTVTKQTFTAYVMLVKDPSRVFLGPTYSYSTAGSGKQIFQAVQMEDAVAGINGGEFSDIGGQGTGAQPMGLTYSKGSCVWDDGHYSTFMGFDQNNRLIVENGMTRARADELGIRDGCSFWGQEGDNRLITNEEGTVQFHYATGDTGVAQRTAIGQRADGVVILIVTDGRSASSLGATRNDLVDLFIEYRAVVAGRLDGGSSAMMYYENYAEKYSLDPETLNATQKDGMVNNYKAFTGYRYIPTYFLVRREGA